MMRLHIVFFKTCIADQTGVTVCLYMTYMFTMCLFWYNRNGIVMVEHAPWR